MLMRLPCGLHFEHQWCKFPQLHFLLTKACPSVTAWQREGSQVLRNAFPLKPDRICGCRVRLLRATEMSTTTTGPHWLSPLLPHVCSRVAPLVKWRGHQRCCCCCSVAKSCPTLCDPMDYSTPGFPVLHHLLEFPQTRVHWFGDAIQPSHHRWVGLNHAACGNLLGRLLIILCLDYILKFQDWGWGQSPRISIFYGAKSLLKSVTILLLFYFLDFWLQGMWDLSSPTRDRTWNPCIGRWSLNHWATRKVPGITILIALQVIFTHSLVEKHWISLDHFQIHLQPFMESHLVSPSLHSLPSPNPQASLTLCPDPSLSFPMYFMFYSLGDMNALHTSLTSSA